MKTYAKPEDVKALEETAGNLRDRLLIRLLYYLAARISEILSLTVDDIDFIQGTVIIKQLKKRVKLTCPNCDSRLSKSHKYCPGCSQKVSKAKKEKMEQARKRILPEDEKTLGMLKVFIESGGPVNRNGILLMFGINRHRARQIVMQCSKRVGLSKLINPESGRLHNISPHRLRDAFAVNAVKHDDSGDGLRMLQEHLGHQTISTTMRYRKVAGEEHRQWYEKLWGKEDKE